MYTLRLTQTKLDEDKFRVEIAFEGTSKGDILPRQTVTTDFSFKLDEQDYEEIRWYLEDYLEYPIEPAPTIAGRIENKMKEIGVDLFKTLFHGDDDARDLWAMLREKLSETRVEIISGIEETALIPWELLRDPKTDIPLILRAQSFVHSLPQPVQRPKIPSTGEGLIRILLVICRPSGRRDVPFRSISMHILKRLDEEVRATYRLDLLRPPTFERFCEVLRLAKKEDRPYHIVHFDGHGDYLDLSGLFEESDNDLRERLESLINISQNRLSAKALYPRPKREGKHGYLLFENPGVEGNIRFVDGPELGAILTETGVPVLILNACKSAHAGLQEEPGVNVADPHSKVRAFGSLAQEVMDSGAAGVVAMRYNVYVVTAAQFIADLYSWLVRGLTLGEAVTQGRKQLNDKPLREISFDPIPLQDWSVPVVYEAAPLSLFPKRSETETMKITLKEKERVEPGFDAELAVIPDIGFIGRDETLLALDRAFDTQKIVLLHAYAGSGKTETAREFARWYMKTGGLKTDGNGVGGLAIFTSFEHYKPFSQVLDEIERRFRNSLEQSGENWLALDENGRKSVVLKILGQIPILWVWDNVEPVAGFTRGTESRWGGEEQEKLVNFLREARETRVKFLLTSRRDEREWLGDDLPFRIKLPPMPMRDMVKFTKELAERRNKKFTSVEDWRPLLQYTQGNPLTISVLVGQALHDGLKTRDEIEKFVNKLGAGESVFTDEAEEGRSRSLGASLSYGFDHAFSDEEKKQLAILHLFQGYVTTTTFLSMGLKEVEWSLPELHGLTSETASRLFDRAVEIGLLEKIREEYYKIHPVLPWFLRDFYERYYKSQGEEVEERVASAFVEAILLAVYAIILNINEGFDYAIYMLIENEANLVMAKQLIFEYNIWDKVSSCVDRLTFLYQRMNRIVDMVNLVDEILPLLTDPDSGGPFKGMELSWEKVKLLDIFCTDEMGDLSGALKKIENSIDSFDRIARPFLDFKPEDIKETQRELIFNLAYIKEILGKVLYSTNNPDCVDELKESIDMYEKIEHHRSIPSCYLWIGEAFIVIKSIRDLHKADKWLKLGLDKCPEGEKFERSRFMSALGEVAIERFDEALSDGKSEDVVLSFANNAFKYYKDALDLHSLDNPVNFHEIAKIINLIGILFYKMGEKELALNNFKEAVRYYEQSGYINRAGSSRANVALVLAEMGRYQDALDYANAARDNLLPYGERAAGELEEIQKKIDLIEEIIKKSGG